MRQYGLKAARRKGVMKITEYKDFNEEEIYRLYSEAGWTAYTENMTALRNGFQNSLSVLAAYEGQELLGIVRAVGDGFTIVFIQDVLVFPEKRRQGVGTALVKAVLDRYPGVRQIELTSDDTPEAAAFYGAMGFSDFLEIGCRGFMKTGR